MFIEQDEQVLALVSDTRRNSGDIAHEPSIDRSSRHDTAERQTDINEDTASKYSQESLRSDENASVEYVESDVPAEMQEQLIREKSPETDPQRTPSLIQADSESLD